VSEPVQPQIQKVELPDTATKPEPENEDVVAKETADKEVEVKEEVVDKPTPQSRPEINTKKTLIEKVKRYTIDEQGHDASETKEPLYHLESVAEILMNDGESAMKDLSKKYGLDFVIDDLGKSKEKNAVSEVSEKKQPASKPEKQNSAVVPTPAFEQMVSDAENRESRELYKTLFPNDTADELPDISVPDISDIDTKEVGIASDNPISNTATIRFTPIRDNKGNTDHITISSVTKHIDLGEHMPEDISSHTAPSLHQSDFEDFSPSDEFCDIPGGKKLLHKLAKQKRSYFLDTFVSALAIIALLVFLIPPVYDFIIASPKSAMLVCSAFLFVSVAANIDMFFDFKNLLKRRPQFDVLAALCSVSTLSLGITAALTESNAYYIILLCSIILFMRVFCKFKNVSAQHSSLKQIVNKKQKNAVTLINDPATTFAMAKNTIEGDVLVAAHKKTNFLEGFMKHFEFHKTMSGKVSLVFFVTLAISLICGLMAYFYYDSIFSAVFSVSCISCLAALPSVFFIDVLPFSSAAKKLKSNGAMIAGLYGAEKIENANAAVIHINDIFPKGTVTMHNMKVLSDNNIDNILLRAASLTAAVGSPLSAIFKQIAGTNASYSIPDSDTVKYEKNLGISGWVDNEPLFIGNRSLMKAHGIDIPSLEVDKKILRKGYFPVYVATANTACALVVIQYDVNSQVAKELHKITDLGVMLLIENCDPNVTEEMICDYFGLYDDSVKIMTNAGVHMYKNAVPEVSSCSAPAAFYGSGLSFIKIINRASGIKRCNRLLTILYTLFAVFGALYFVYASFSGLTAMPEQTTVLVYALSTTVLSIIGFLIRKP
ncbi:MAG: hypothetical protein IJY79_07140, partial [Clostridia bacterium]|nr:hypothetical protein [Clostridia bacterium]